MRVAAVSSRPAAPPDVDVETTAVVTSFLLRRGPGGPRLLLLRRSARVGTYRGRWAGISGYLEGPEPLRQALREIEEEAGLSPEDVRLLRAGEPLPVPDPALGRRWLVHPFLFELLPGRALRLDWEHTCARWARPETVFLLPTVPRLPETLQRVYPLVGEGVEATARALAQDRQRGARELAAAALGQLALAADRSPMRLRASACYLARARPAVPAIALAVAHAYARARSVPHAASAIQAFRQAMGDALREAAACAAGQLPSGAVLTYSRSSSVTAALLARRPARVLVSEGRPGQEGVALARELTEAGVPVTLAADVALPALVAEAEAVVVGADALLADGSFLNKTGTFPLALAARRFGVPFYVVAETWKVLPPRVAPLVEEWELDVPAMGGAGVGVSFRPFETTPGTLVTAYLTEDGPLPPRALRPYSLRAREAWRALFGRPAADLA